MQLYNTTSLNITKQFLICDCNQYFIALKKSV